MSAILDLLRSGQAEPGSSREALTQGESSTLAAEPTFDDVLPGRHNDRIVLTYTPLDEKAALAHVRDNGAGATCLFVGTTRDDFQGRSGGQARRDLGHRKVLSLHIRERASRTVTAYVTFLSP